MKSSKNQTSSPIFTQSSSSMKQMSGQMKRYIQTAKRWKAKEHGTGYKSQNDFPRTKRFRQTIHKHTRHKNINYAPLILWKKGCHFVFYSFTCILQDMKISHHHIYRNRRKRVTKHLICSRMDQPNQLMRGKFTLKSAHFIPKPWKRSHMHIELYQIT